MASALKLAGLALAVSLASGAQAEGPAPNDAQIAAIVVTANQVDIDAGKLAEQKAQSRDVQDFGRLMAIDHAGVNQAATALVQRLKLTPEDNPTAQGLKQGGNDNLEKLLKLRGPEFDKAYVDHEVSYHQAVLDAVDRTLIPNARNEDLKALLVKVRPAFVAHLEHAKQLQARLGKSGG